MLVWIENKEKTSCKNYKKYEIPDWVLINDDNKDEIIALINVYWKNENICDIEAICNKIGYVGKFENRDKWQLRIIIHDLRKTIARNVSMLSDHNKRPTEKKIFEMIDGIPIWSHLKNGISEIEIRLTDQDYGKMGEVIGNRIIDKITKRDGIFEDLFPTIKIINVHNIEKVIKDGIGLGDKILELAYKKDLNFGKKIVIFEIKHGKVVIEQNQLRRYCSMIINPEQFFNKADELRLIFVMIDKLDTVNASTNYSLKEIDKDFACTILANEVVEDYGAKIKEQ